MGIIGSCLWGCVSCFVGDIAGCCMGCFPRDFVVKISYLVIVILVVAPAIALFYAVSQWNWFIDNFQQYMKCPGSGDMSCLGASVVYRFSLPLLIMFLLLCLIMICRNRIARVINEGLFFIKYLAIVALFIGFLFVKNTVFLSFGEACKGISVVYMLIQAIVLIDLFYMWGLKWFRRWQDGQGCFAFLLIFFTVLNYCAALGLHIWAYIKFKNCTLWVNIVTTILTLIIPGIQLLGFNPQNSLLTSSAVTLYMIYLSFMGQLSYPSCGALDSGAMAADLTSSVFFFILTTYGSILGGSFVFLSSTPKLPTEPTHMPSHENFQMGNNGMAPQYPPAPNQLQMENADPEQQAMQNDAGYWGWEWVKWHFMMAIASMYIAMMVTNWGSLKESDPLGAVYRSSLFGFWVRVATSWCTFILYIWTLVAPRICVGREFYIE